MMRFNGGAGLVGGWLVLLLCVAPLGLAQVRLEPPGPPGPAKPGDFVTLVFTVHNDGSSEARVTFDLDLPRGISSLGGVPPLELAPQAEGKVFLTVIVSAQALAGENPIGLTAQAGTSSASATVSIEVVQVPGLAVVAPAEVNLEPDQASTLTFQVTNLGNASDRVALSLEAPSALQATLAQTTLDLLPGETKGVEVSLRASDQAPAGLVRLTLKANSTLFPGVGARAMARVTVLPPLPQSVDGLLVLQVPSELSLALNLSSHPQRAASWTADFGGSADFNDADHVEYRLAFDDLTLRAMRFALDRGPFESRLGELTLNWGQLLTLRGAGAQVGLQELPSGGHLRVAALSPSFQPRLGAQLGFSWLELDMTVSQVLRWKGGQPLRLTSVSLHQQLPAGFSLQSEWALSQLAGRRAGGVVLQAGLDQPPYSLQAEWIRTGTHFAGNRPDTQGFSLVQSFSEENWALRLNFSRRRNNVGQDPARLTQVETSWFSTLRWSPAPQRASLLFSLNFNGVQDPAGGAGSRLEAQVRLNQPLSQVATTGLFVLRRVDGQVQDTLETWTLGTDGAFFNGTVFSLLRVSYSTTRSLVNGAFQGRTLDALASVQLSSDRGRFTLTGLGGADGISLQARLEGGVSPWRVAANLELGNLRDTPFDLQGQLVASLEFDAPLAFLPVKGRVEGTVFEDLNQDGQRGPDEPGVGNLVLEVGAVKVRTDERGGFRTPPLDPQTAAVKFEQLPFNLIPADPRPPIVVVRPGRTEHLVLALNRIAVIQGVVFNDQDQSGTQEETEPGLPGARVWLEAEDGSTFTLTGPDGTFTFRGLAPGPVRVWLDVASLPARFEPTTPASVELTLEQAAHPFVAFGAFQRPQTVKFVPTADFEFSPPSPRAGQPVSFDGTSSFDPDGQVVAYAWDFDGDGQPDATGPTASFTYPQPGAFEVTLTVTDNEGNTDSLSKTVPVLPAAPHN